MQVLDIFSLSIYIQNIAWFSLENSDIETKLDTTLIYVKYAEMLLSKWAIPNELMFLSIVIY